MELDIIIKRPDKTFSPGEKVRGVVKVTSKTATKHSGLRLLVEGGITFQYTGSNNMNLFDVVMSSFKPIKLVDFSMELATAGKLPEGTTEIPFEFTLQQTESGGSNNTSSSGAAAASSSSGGGGHNDSGDSETAPLIAQSTSASATNTTPTYKLYSTYHGVYLSVRYKVHAEMKFGFFTRDMKKALEFYVSNNGQGFLQKHVQLEQDIMAKKMNSDVVKQFRREFDMEPSKLQNVRKSLIGIVPDYHIVGHLTLSVCNIGRPFTGEITVVKSAVNIKSIELQLVRVESCSVADGGMVKEATEIQNLQLADGNIPVGFSLPIYMIFPRLFTCPTLITQNFRVEFEVNIIVLFTDGHQITENVPLRLYSGKNEVGQNRLKMF